MIGTDRWWENTEHYLLYGAPLLAPGMLTPDTIEQNGGVYIEGASEFKPIGDLDGDGLDDWLLQPTDTDAAIVWGRSDPYPSPLDIDSSEPGLATRLLGTTLPDRAESVSSVYPIGDFTGDGLADLVIMGETDYEAAAATLVLLPGVRGARPAIIDPGAMDGASTASLRFGRYDSARDGIRWLAQLPGIHGKVDINGDGLDDLLLSGHATAAVNGAYVLFGSSAGLPEMMDFQTLDGNNGFALLASVPTSPPIIDDAPTQAIDIGSIGVMHDSNGDGRDDLLVDLGLHGAGTRFRTQVHLVPGDAGPWPAILSAAAVADRSLYHVSGASAAQLGDAGDLNGDGLGDYWLVEASFFRTSGVHVVYGRDGAFEDFELGAIDGVRGFRIAPSLASDYLYGLSVVQVGDVDGDGADDLLLGDSSASGPVGDIDSLLDGVRDPDPSPSPGLAALVFGRTERGAPASPWKLYPVLAPGLIELRWQVASGEAPTGFEIWRNGAPLVGLDGEARHFEDTTAMPGARYTYEAIAVEADGRRSSPIVVSANNDIAHPQIGGAVYSDTLAEIFWVDDLRRRFWEEGLGRYYSVRRDGLLLDLPSAHSYLDREYDPGGHTYSVETDLLFPNRHNEYVVRSSILSLPEQDGTRPPGPVSELEFILRDAETLELSWRAAPWGSPPLRYEVSRDGIVIGTASDAEFALRIADDVSTYEYVVVTVDGNGRRSRRASFWPEIHAARQAVLPARADELSVAASTDTAITLRWEVHPVGTAASAYEVRRDDVVVARTTKRSYTATDLTRDTRYVFAIVAIDGKGRRSEESYLTATSAGGPLAPASVSALVYSATTLEVMWPRMTSGATYPVAYEVYRDDRLIATVDALSLMQRGLEPDTEYRFALRSVAADGRRSPDSVETTVRTSAN